MARRLSSMDMLLVPKGRKFSFAIYYLLCNSRHSFSRSKKYFLRRFGARVGENVYFGPGTTLLCTEFGNTTIGDGVQINKGAYISCSSATIGEDVRIDQDVLIKGRSGLVVGDGVYIGFRTFIDLNEDVVIEEGAGVGPGSWIWTHSVWQPVTEGGPRSFAPVRIGRGAWIPSQVFILPSVNIGENAIVAGASTVIKDVPPGSLVGGNPAKVIRTKEQMRTDMTLQDIRKVTVEIITDFVSYIQKNHFTTQEAVKSNNAGTLYVLSTKIKKRFGTGQTRWGILLLSAASPGNLPYIKATADRLERLVLISVDTIGRKTLENLDNMTPRLIWFDIKSKRRSDGWDWHTMLVHNFFRGRYGVRFKRQRKTESK